ncbi:hypothetical protein SeMB42_g04392 [Synchytrium endobioticum]|uniref:histone deacetylase n=1 Tax=Synchytrium endobioticum TaxID=286115 RepID=A0A507CYN3_9FUNG|nr:hypothetical protein SeMB42_g04392 [Synchytrium endobioticum]TPX50216.1 hypothetical protein SeLEV6574_g01058 [Synchytrium endobioticum]
MASTCNEHDQLFRADILHADLALPSVGPAQDQVDLVFSHPRQTPPTTPTPTAAVQPPLDPLSNTPEKSKRAASSQPPADEPAPKRPRLAAHVLHDPNISIQHHNPVLIHANEEQRDVQPLLPPVYPVGIPEQMPNAPPKELQDTNVVAINHPPDSDTDDENLQPTMLHLPIPVDSPVPELSENVASILAMEYADDDEDDDDDSYGSDVASDTYKTRYQKYQAHPLHPNGQYHLFERDDLAPPPPDTAKLPTRKPTAVFYDERMLQHYCMASESGSGHPERPERLMYTLRLLEKKGIIDYEEEVEGPLRADRSDSGTSASVNGPKPNGETSSNSRASPFNVRRASPGISSYNNPRASPSLPANTNVARASSRQKATTIKQTGQCKRILLDERRRQGLLQNEIFNSGVHHPEWIAWVEGMSELGLDKLHEEALKYQDLYFSPNSQLAATVSCAGVIAVCEAVWKGECQNGFAIVRPPGHHAEYEEPMGFCIFNNVAVAARQLQRVHGVQRILIVDWDVHHGNGTQHEFYRDPDIMYISLHRYDGYFFPKGHGEQDGYDSFVGGPGAEGRNINIPWPRPHMGDREYMYAFHRVVMPIAREFRPEFVIVSAGFDCAAGDPLGECCVTPAGFANMAYQLCSLANGKVVMALEGGYNIRSIAKSVAECCAVLLGLPPPEIQSDDQVRKLPPDVARERDFAWEAAAQAIEQVVRIQSRYWRSLATPRFLTAKYDSEMGLDIIPLNNVLKVYYANKLRVEFGLELLEDSPSQLQYSPETDQYRTPDTIQIFTTRNFIEQPGMLVVLVHDNWDLVRSVNLSSTNMASMKKAHSYVADATCRLMDLFKQSNIPVVDVKIQKDDFPEHLSDGYVRDCAGRALRFLWDGYLQHGNRDKIYFVGAGVGAWGVSNLVRHRNITSKTVGVSLVLGEPYPPSVTEYFENWYRKHSLVLVPSIKKKINTVIDCDARYGKVKSGGPPAETITELIARHEEAIWSHFDKCSGWQPSPVGVDLDDNIFIGNYLIGDSEEFDNEDIRPRAAISRHSFDSDEGSSDEEEEDDDGGEREAGHQPTNFMDEDSQTWKQEGDKNISNDNKICGMHEDATADAIALGLIGEERSIVAKEKEDGMTGTRVLTDERTGSTNAQGNHHMGNGGNSGTSTIVESARASTQATSGSSSNNTNNVDNDIHEPAGRDVGGRKANEVIVIDD